MVHRIYKYFHEVSWELGPQKLLSHYGSRTKDNSSSSLHFQDNMKVLLHIYMETLHLHTQQWILLGNGGHGYFKTRFRIDPIINEYQHDGCEPTGVPRETLLS